MPWCFIAVINQYILPAILDSQSVKGTESSNQVGYDAGKKVKGIKRHIVVDTLGLILKMVVLTSDIQDRDGAHTLLVKVKGEWPRLQKVWADGGYAGSLVERVQETCHWILEIVKRSDLAKGFEVLPHRWIVERTFGWLIRSRHLSKNYERLTTSSEAMVFLAMLPVMTRRLAKQQTCFASTLLGPCRIAPNG